MKTWMLLILCYLMATCKCMNLENNEENKKKESVIATINHIGTVKNITFNLNKTFLLFEEERTTEYSTERMVSMYDIQNNSLKKSIFGIQPNTKPCLSETAPDWVGYTHEHNNLPKYSVFNLKDNSQVTRLIKQETQLDPNFIIQGRHVLMPLYKNNSYGILTLKKQEEQVFEFDDDIQECYKSPNKQYLLFSVQNKGSMLHDTLNDRRKPVSFCHLKHKAYNPSSTLLAFFEPKNKTVVLYDLEHYKRIKEMEYENDIADLYFPNDSTIVFSFDRITYYVYHIKKEAIDVVQLDDKNYESWYDAYPHHERYFHFQLYACSQCVVYDAKKATLHVLPVQGVGTRVLFNHDATYALICTNASIALLYETETWNLVRGIMFEGTRQTYAQFSPCGRYVAIEARDFSDEPSLIKVYDLQQQKTIFKESLAENQTRSAWYDANTLICASNAHTITFFNASSQKKKEIIAEQAIASYAINNNLLVISTGKQTTLIKLTNIEYDQECTLPKSEEISMFSSKKQTIPDTITLYNPEGDLHIVTIDKKTNIEESSENCTIL